MKDDPIRVVCRRCGADLTYLIETGREFRQLLLTAHRRGVCKKDLAAIYTRGVERGRAK